MHRSGTSALAGALVRLGLQPTREDDLMAPSEANPRGYFESRSLSVLSDRVLDTLGGSWDVPPEADPGWELAPELEVLRAQARDAVGSVFPAGPVAWKNPRTCLLLPFWKQVIVRPGTAVLVWRDPAAVALSMHRADGMSIERGIALWDHYNRQAWRDLGGLPTLVVCYDALLQGDPPAWEGIGLLASSIGLPGPSEAGAGSAGEFLDGGLRHETGARDDALGASVRELLAEVDPLAEALRESSGWHGGWLPDRLPDQGERVGALLAECRSASRTAQAWAAYLSVGSAPALSVSMGLAGPIHGRSSRAPASAVPLLTRATTTGNGTRGNGTRENGTRGNDRDVRVSVVMSVEGASSRAVSESVESVRSQSHRSWELSVCLDGSAAPGSLDLVSQGASAGERITVTVASSAQGSSALLRSAVSMAGGEIVVFLGAGDVLYPGALEAIVSAFGANPSLGALYGDHDIALPRGEQMPPTPKPEWSPIRLLGDPYVGRVVAIRHSLVDALGGIREGSDGAEVYDLLLRAAEVSAEVEHLGCTLGAWRPPYAAREPGALAEDPWLYAPRQRAVEASLSRSHRDVTLLPGPLLGTLTVRPAVPAGRSATVVLAPGATATQLQEAADAVVSAPGWADFEVLLVCSEADKGRALERTVLSRLSLRPRHRVVEVPRGAAATPSWRCEALVKAAGDAVVFLGPGVLPTADGWLKAMLECLEHPGTALVGGSVSAERAQLSSTNPELQERLCEWPGAPMRPPGVAGEVDFVEELAFALVRSTIEDLFVEGEAGRAPDVVELCQGLRARGLSFLYTPLARFVAPGPADPVQRPATVVR